jgi:hypothetical protein
MANKVKSILLPEDLKELIIGADGRIVRKSLNLFASLGGGSLRFSIAEFRLGATISFHK